MKLNMDLLHLHVSAKIEECRRALAAARAATAANHKVRDRTVTFHHFVMSNAEILQFVRADAFCKLVGVKPSFETEFDKMVKLGLWMKDHA